MKVLVIQNDIEAPIGTFGTYLRDVCCAQVDVIDACDFAKSSLTGSYDLYVILGSRLSTNDLSPEWVSLEIDLIRDLLAAGRPLVGICFGAQAIARAAGGSVAKMGRWRQGWMSNDETTAELWHGPWLNWHNETITLPNDAELMATSDGTVQAFQVGSAVCVQFHPEVTRELVRNWGAVDGSCEAAGFHDEGLIPRTRQLFDELIRRAVRNAR